MHIVNMLQKNPVSDKERKDLIRPAKPTSGPLHEAKEHLNCTTGRLTSVLPQTPVAANISNQSANDLLAFRKTLPIWNLKNDIMKAVNDNSVVMITGDTGCGKTTQVPQFILECAHFEQEKVRIIAAEPRRLAALAVAERVTAERGELMGQTVGYQIRLESK